MGNEVEWFNNTERLTFKTWMDGNIEFAKRNLQHWSSQGVVYLQSYSKARLHKARAAKYRQILSLFYLGFVSFVVLNR